MSYILEVEDAVKYGVNEALFLSNLRFWIKKNRANNVNFHDGRYWTYNTFDAYKIIFPFWSTDQIKNILKKLINKKVIMKGTFSKNKFDRTGWYTVLKDIVIVENDVQCLAANLPNAEECGFLDENMPTAQETPIRQNYLMQEAELPNVITDINKTYINTNTHKKCSKKEQQEMFDESWLLYGYKVAKKTALKAWSKLAPEDIQLIPTAIKEQLEERALKDRHGIWQPERKHFATWLHNECWNDTVMSAQEIKRAKKSTKMEEPHFASFYTE